MNIEAWQRAFLAALAEPTTADVQPIRDALATDNSNSGPTVYASAKASPNRAERRKRKKRRGKGVTR